MHFKSPEVYLVSGSIRCSGFRLVGKPPVLLRSPVRYVAADAAARPLAIMSAFSGSEDDPAAPSCTERPPVVGEGDQEATTSTSGRSETAAEPAAKTACAFYMRTGTCAYVSGSKAMRPAISTWLGCWEKGGRNFQPGSILAWPVLAPNGRICTRCCINLRIQHVGHP